MHFISRELGFQELYGANALSTAQLGALGIQLKKLERQYGTITDGKTYQSEIAMWRAMNEAYTKDFAKIGIEITYQKQSKHSDRFRTQIIGQY